MATTDIYHIIGSVNPARDAAKFIATADQACVIDAHAIAREAAEDAAGTYTAWVNIPDITGNYGIVSCGDTAAIEFITMRITAGKLVGECNDGTVDQWEHTSTNVVITPHKWHHIALAQGADLEAPRLYVDGERIAQTATLATDNGTWFADCGLIDDGSIGAAEEAGAAGQIRECKGAISDVKYWKVQLTDAQVKEDYQGRDPTTINTTAGVSNLTDWWKMKDLTNEATAANVIVKGASILFCNGYSEFTSRLSFATGTPVDEDNVSIAVSDGVGHCVVIKAA